MFLCAFSVPKQGRTNKTRIIDGNCIKNLSYTVFFAKPLVAKKGLLRNTTEGATVKTANVN